MAWHDGLTERQRRFVEEFAANGGNATKAAKAAGYAHPHVKGSQTLEKVSVREAIEALRLATTNPAIATREQRQVFWSRVIRGEETYFDHKLGCEVPYPIEARLRASELLGKSQGDFVHRREDAGRGRGALRIVQLPPKEAAQRVEELREAIVGQ